MSISQLIDEGVLDDMGDFYDKRSRERSDALAQAEGLEQDETTYTIVVELFYGPKTNLEQLKATVAEAAFQMGCTDVDWLDPEPYEDE